ncbi:MAG TPA: helix-turn-helix domain-containing protein [Actinocrinis sp.]|nr:helix-turn-helix domain-containing protein [Actinocrinis sp.]
MAQPPHQDGLATRTKQFEEASVRSVPGPNKKVLGEFLKHLRDRTPRKDPPPVGGSPWRSHKETVTQAQAAQATGMTEGWWRQHENGLRRLDSGFVYAVIREFHLSHEERNLLWDLALGNGPVLEPNPYPAEVSPQIQAIVNALPLPAYVSDPAWDCVIHNDAAVAWFPELGADNVAHGSANVMVQALTSPSMRSRLVDWEHQWAIPMLANLRATLTWLPIHPTYRQRLEAVLKVVTCHPDVARIWDEHQATFHLDPNGAIRSVQVGGEARPVRLATTDLPGGCRQVVLTPADLG